MLKDFQLLNDESTYVAFHIPSSKIIRLNKNSFEIAFEIKSGVHINQITSKYSLSQEVVYQFIENLNKSIPFDSHKIDNCIENKYIDRITVHIANDCNLSCSYCYANGGNYKMKKKLMSSQTADDLVLFLTANFDKIGDIVFFGGEPLLNYKIIDRICQNIHSRVTKENLPRFNIITNGTIINEDIIDIINKYIDSVVVSVDGPPDANDLHRRYKNGKGSFSKIETFINTVKEKTNKFVQFEATYTKEHYEKGYSQNDIHSFLKEHFKISGSVIEEMLTNNAEKKINISISDIVSDMFNETKKRINLNQNTIDIILSIAKGIKRTMCPVGENTISISVDGGIHLCHVLINESSFGLGSIYTENIITNKEKYYQLYPFFKTISKGEDICLNCWAVDLCGGCVLRWFYDFKEIRFFSNPDPNLCLETKEYLKQIILNLAKIQSNDKKFNSFIERLKKEVNHELC